MSGSKKLISAICDHMEREGKTVLSAAVMSGLKSVNDHIRETSGNPDESLSFGSLLTALKGGALSAGQQIMATTFDRLNERAAKEE